MTTTRSGPGPARGPRRAPQLGMLGSEMVIFGSRFHTKQSVPRLSRMFRGFISTQDHVLAPRDTRTRPLNVPTFLVAEHITIMDNIKSPA